MSRILPIKLRRDLRASWSRFVLMVLALTISLTAFGGLLYAWSASGRETGGAYASTEPASATILLDKGIDAARLNAITAELRDRPQIVEATGRSQFDTEVEVDGRRLASPLQVFVAAEDDPMRMAKFDARTPSAWPARPGELLVTEDTLDQLGVSIGDTITITAPGGRDRTVRVARTVYDPGLAPSPQEQRGHGYLSAATLPAGGTGLDQVKLQISEPGGSVPTADRETAVSVAERTADRLRSEYGLGVLEIQVPQPYAHPHQWQSDAILGSLLAGAAAALLLSAILVATMLNGLFVRQIPQIGIMKAVGARAGRIGGFYLAMTLLVASAATLLALVPAAMTGGTLLERSLAMLGIRPVTLAPSWWAYVVIVAVGLALPTLAALVPVTRASRRTVREAIDHHGGTTRPSRAAAALARLGRRGRIARIDRGLLLALRNSVARPARFWLSVGLLSTAGTVFVSGMSMSAGAQAVTEERIEQRTWDVDVALAAPSTLERARSALDRVPGIERVEGFAIAKTGIAPQGRIPVTRTYPDQGHGSLSVAGVPSGAATMPKLPLASGRRPQAGETDTVLLNTKIRTKNVPGVGIGDKVTMYVDGRPSTWRVVGFIEEREGLANAYTTPEGLAAATGRPGRIDRLRIVTDRPDERTRTSVAAAVHTALTDAGLEVKSSASVSRSDAISAGHMGPVILILVGVAVPLGVIGIIGLASTMSAGVLDRTREFGVMHAIGARPKTVRRTVILEGVLLALISCVVAAVPTVGLTSLLGTGFGNLFMSAPLPYRISPTAIGLWLVIVVLGAIVATDAAAARASRMTVREALAYL